MTMRNNLTLFRKTIRSFHGITKEWNIGDSVEVCNSRVSLKKDLATKVPKERKNASIYRVPVNMRDVQPNAYAPNIISIGPYHHGDERLKEMEQVKWEFFHRLFLPERSNGVDLDQVLTAMEESEKVARSYFWDEAEQLSKDKFVKMMLLDGCFIVELFRELKKNNFCHARFIKRWMLPSLRRDLIMLENQLPLFVLRKLFELTNRSATPISSLEELALCFFKPLLQRESKSDVLSINSEDMQKRQHFLDLFRFSILPTCLSKETGKACAYHGTDREISGTEETTDMMKSVKELTEAGVIIKKCVNFRPLDVRSSGRLMKIPPLYIDDYKGTLFRNIVAYEQCHFTCKPDVTSYLFFFDGLINSAHDVELLHHKGVLHHSLGSNKEVARLVNGLCKEIARDGGNSYLHKVVSDCNSFCDTYYARIRSRLVHHYFSSWVVGISTFGAVIVLYLTLLQTAYGYVGDPPKLQKPFHCHLLDCLILPVCHLFTFEKKQRNCEDKSNDDSEQKDIIDCF